MSTNNSHSGVSMRLLLLNNNPAVSRLIKLSADKVGYELDEFSDYSLVPLLNYDVVMVDNELYEEVALEELCEQAGCEYVIYICQRGSQKPNNVNSVLEKPFLPTDFLVMLDKAKNILDNLKSEKDRNNESVDHEGDVSEETIAFDIDQIDTLGDGEEESLPLYVKEDETPEDTTEDEPMSDFQNFEDVELNDLNLEDELMDVSHKQSETKSDEKGIEQEKIVDSLSPEVETENFNFDDENDEKISKEVVADAQDEEALSTPCVLDKDDINEVKQLLDDDEAEQEDEEIAEMVELESEKDESQFFFNDAPVEDDTPSDALELPSLEESLMDEDKVLTPSLEFDAATEPIEEEQEEIIDAFEDILDEKTIDENEMKEQTFEENDTLVSPHVDVAVEEAFTQKESAIPCVDTAKHRVDFDSEIDSLDDLNENLLKNAFGEEVIEEESSAIPEPVEIAEDKEIEVIRGEIENSVAKSISSLAKSDILREALKGMRINISITFDDKE